MGEEKVRRGLYLDKDLYKQIETHLTVGNARNKSEFVSDAVRFYIGYLQCEEDSRYLTPALESFINGCVTDTENRIARVMYKQAVEMGIMMHVLAGAFNLAQEDIDKLRKRCVNEINRTNGKYNFKDIAKFQSGE